MADDIQQQQTTTPEPTVESGSLEEVVATAAADHLTEDQPTPETTPQPQEEPLSEIDQLIEAEMGAGHSKKRENRIPYARTAKIIENARKKLADAHAAELQQHTTRIAEFEAKLQEVAAVEQMMLTNPQLFLQALAQMNPVYGQLFGGQLQQVPDDVQALQQFIEQQVSARVGPIEQEYRSRTIVQQAMPKVQQQMAEAETWPLFNENRDGILKELQANPRISLEGAYQKVVLPKLAASRDQMRQEVMAELQTRPHSTSAIPSLASRQEEAEPQSLEDIVAKAAGLRR